VIARSEEVKEAGVPMGAPVFEWEETLDEIGAEVLSSNYTLYGDMSRRVHSLIEEEALALEPCSIDEAFATFPALSRENLHRLTDRIRRRIRGHLCIEVHVGIGPTKTLAKNENPR
jgi:DNA polymerase V